jgi:hypothetical protein
MIPADIRLRQESGAFVYRCGDAGEAVVQAGLKIWCEKVDPRLKMGWITDKVAATR